MQKFLRRRHLLRKPSRYTWLLETLVSGGITLKEKIFQAPVCKELFGYQKTVFLKS